MLNSLHRGMSAVSSFGKRLERREQAITATSDGAALLRRAKGTANDSTWPPTLSARERFVARLEQELREARDAASRAREADSPLLRPVRRRWDRASWRGRRLVRLAKLDLLAIDDWMLAPLRDTERRDLTEVIEDRAEPASTLIASQLPVTDWHAVIGDPNQVDAICDRLLHDAHRIELKGRSMRRTHDAPGKPTKETT